MSLFGGSPSPFGFGQSQPQPGFGAAQSSPFGSSATFGQPASPSPFGASSSTGGLFGQTQPAFGASTSAFGASSSTAFGSSAFGAKPAGTGFAFGATPSSPFGASAPAFGASTGLSFGQASSPAFGATGSSFGAAGFGAASSSAFGASTTTSVFGSTPSFGSTMPVFGAASSTPAFGTPPASTSFGSPAPFGANTSSVFGSTTTTTTPTGGLFGSSPAFGGTTFGAGAAGAKGTRVAPYQKSMSKDSSATGAPSVAFCSITAMDQYKAYSIEELRWEDYQAGVKSSTSAATAPTTPLAPTTSFGGFGTTTPAFGATPASPFMAASSATPSPFGSTTSAFGASSPGGSLFSTPASGFGAASTPAATPPSGFSGFGTPVQSSPGGLFGTTSSTPSLFGASSSPSFSTGFGSTTAFGASQTAFGAPATTSAFGASTGSLFGTPASTPAFGASTTPSLFGAPAASTASLFGSSTTTTPFGSFGAAKPATPSAFGASTTPFWPQSSTPAFTPSPGLLSSAPPTAAAFSFTTTTLPGTLATNPATPAPTVGASPYGVLPQLPTVTLPEPKVGISQRPIRQTIRAPRPSPLMNLQRLSPEYGVSVARGVGISPASSTGRRENGSASMVAGGAGEEGKSAVSSRSSMLLPVRDNPRRLFIREPPPSTTAAPSTSLTPLRPSTGKRGTPGTSGTPEPSTPTEVRSQEAPRRISQVPDEIMPVPGVVEDDHEKEPAQPQHLSLPPSQPENVLAPPATELLQVPTEVQVDSQPQNGVESAERFLPLLPKFSKLRAAGYQLKPSLTEMLAMARENEGLQLSEVEGLTISKEGLGSMKWLEPVDVRGLDLDNIIMMEPGRVGAYTKVAKPPVGQGLNCRCEITLYNIQQHTKPSGSSSKDMATLQAFEKRLKRLCADSDSKFISYRPDGGVWKFQVDHFSIYGLPEDGLLLDEEELCDLMDAQEERLRENLMEAEDPEDDGSLIPVGEASSMGLVGGSSRKAAMDMGLADGDEVRAAPLQHSLPLLMSSNPSDLMVAREVMFGGPQGWQGEGTGPRSARHHLSQSGRVVNCWRPLGKGQDVAGGAQQLAVLLADSRRAQSIGVTPLPSPRCEVVQAALREAQSSSVALSDAGLFHGRASRVGWGPGGVLVTPDNPTGAQLAGGARPGQITVKKVNMLTGLTGSHAGLALGPVEDLMREKLMRLLENHRKYSECESVMTEDELIAAEGVEVVRWRPRREAAALQGLVQEHRQAVQHLLSHEGVCEPLQSCLQQEQSTWQLLQLLYQLTDSYHELDLDLSIRDQVEGGGSLLRQVPGEDAVEGPGLDLDLNDMDEDVARDEELEFLDEDVDDYGSPPLRRNTEAMQSKLHELQQHAVVSAWLAQQSLPALHRSLPRCAQLLESVCYLLASRQLPAAMAMAAAVGDVRLSTIIAQAGLHNGMVDDIEAWLKDRSTCLSDMRKVVCQLLVGDVPNAQQVLKMLSWKQTLGLYCWYGHRSCSLKTGINAYTASLEPGVGAAGTALPLPDYLEAAGQLPVTSSRGRQPYVSSMQHELLKLYVAPEEDRRYIPDSGLSKLMRYLGYSPCGVDGGLAWHVLEVLQALEALPEGPDNHRGFTQGYRACLDVISQVVSLGCGVEWAVYLAMCLPPHREHPGLREAVVEDLINRHVEEWSEETGRSSKKQRLVEDFKLPVVLLERARAMYLGYRGDAWGQAVHLLRSGDVLGAHRCLVGLPGATRFVNYQHQGDLELLLHQMQQKRDLIPGWDMCGAIYSNYFTLSTSSVSHPAGDAGILLCNKVSELLSKREREISRGDGRASAVQHLALQRIGSVLADWSAVQAALGATSDVEPALIAAAPPHSTTLMQLLCAQSGVGASGI